MKKTELAIIMPLYNEEGSIEKVIRKWIMEFRRLEIRFELHVYNDGSKDNSWKILQALNTEFEELHIHNKENTGHGPTILRGYREQMDKPWLFQIDSDDELDIFGFEELWQSRKDYDFLIGSRGNRNSPAVRTFITWFTALTTRIFYGPGIKDVNSPFRLLRTAAFGQLFHKIPANTFAPNVIISGYAAYKKLGIKELKIKHQFRTTGEVSIKRWKLLRAAVQSFWQTIRFRFLFF